MGSPRKKIVGATTVLMVLAAICMYVQTKDAAYSGLRSERGVADNATRLPKPAPKLLSAIAPTIPMERSLPKSWTPIISWSGSGIKQTETFSTSGKEWRIIWHAGNVQFNAGMLQIMVYDSHGELVTLCANHLGVGQDISYVRAEPGEFYLMINSANEDWDVKVEQLEVGSTANAPSSSLPDLQMTSIKLDRLRWGMSLSEIAAIEPVAAASVNDPQTLLADDKVSGIPARLAFDCNKDQGLNSIFVVPYPETQEELKSNFLTWYGNLSSRYGMGRLVHSRSEQDGQQATPKSVQIWLNNFSSHNMDFAIQFEVDSQTNAYVGVRTRGTKQFAYQMLDSSYAHPNLP